MTILFLGLGKATPTFIDRRVEALRREGVRVLTGKVISAGYKRQLSGRDIIPIFDLSSARSLMVLFLSVLGKPVRLCNIVSIFRNIEASKRIRTRILLALRYHRLLEYRVDLIHIQWIAHVAAFRWLYSVLQVPVVASARGSMVTVYPAVRPDYPALLRECFHLSDAVHCVSEDIKKACVALGANPGKCFVNYNGIDTEKFEPGNTSDYTGSCIRMISVGALMWRKGAYWQLLLIKELLKDGIPVEHTIIGNGSLREGLLYQARKLGVEDRVKFIGQCSEDEVVRFLQQADIYLSTSAAEGLSNSVMEAAACALPVVAFDCEGMHEIILTGKTGYIVPFGDICAMKEKVYRLAVDGGLRQAMGKEGRQHVIANFDMKQTVPAMVEKYRSILTNHGSNA